MNQIAQLKAAPRRIGTLSVPIPSTRALANYVYPNVGSIMNTVREIVPFEGLHSLTRFETKDVPNEAFKGPF